MKRKLLWIPVILCLLVVILFSGMLLFATNQLLFPSWRGVTKDLSVCKAETAKYWGAGCGNLRTTHELNFSEIQIPSVSGYALPGWLIKTEDNGMGKAKGAIMLVHSGGSDRREETRYIKFFLSQGLDVITFDLACHGEAPCPVPGMTYGHRESRDVLSVYLYLTDKYPKVYAMGNSVGAASILIALPEMPKLAGVIADSPFASFQRLVTETPASKGSPAWFNTLFLGLTMQRGKFDGLLSPEHSLQLVKTTPILFVDSKKDNIVPNQQNQELANAYAGPKITWFPDLGNHTTVWDVAQDEYQKKIIDLLTLTQ